MYRGLVVSFLTLLVVKTSAQHSMTNFFVAPRIGWTQEKLNWNIAGDEQGSNPNVLSELNWEELRGPAFEIASGIELIPNLYIRGEMAYQRITVGKVSDTDYAADDRTWQTARFDLRANEGRTLEYCLAILYEVWSNGRFSVRPHVDYFGRRQTLYMLDGDIPLLPERELRSTYEPRWNGALLGVEIKYSRDRFDLSYDIAASRVMRYAAEASWNLQEDFRQPVSFLHRAKGNGWDSSLTAGYRVNAAIRPFVYAGYSQLVVRNGTDELYHVDGQVLKTRLNSVNASGIRVGAGLQLAWRSKSNND